MALPDWLYISQATGTSGTTTISVSAGTNTIMLPKLSELSASFLNGENEQKVSVYQYASGYTDNPNYYENTYLSIEALSGNCAIYWRTTDSRWAKTIEYSKDNGTTWSSITSSVGSTAGISLNIGEKAMFRGGNQYYGLIYEGGGYNYFYGNNYHKVYGNLMSLIYGDNFVNYTNIYPNLDAESIFWGLFAKDTMLFDAENLYFPKDDELYRKGYYAYGEMFSGCTKLTKAPKEAYINGANGQYMFAACTSLKTAPGLPCKRLRGQDYIGMFVGCTKLESADLPATQIAGMCYESMFSGCTRLEYIRCKALPPWSSNAQSYPFNGWVESVPTYGTFVKDINTEITTLEAFPSGKFSRHRGTSGIPDYWIVLNEY